MEYGNKITIVTGASSGLGRSVAIELAKRGATVYGLARRVDELNKTRELMRLYNPDCDIFQCDVSNQFQVDKSIESIVRRSSSIDILINNAAIVSYKAFLDVAFDELKKIIDTNLIGAMYVTQRVLRVMTKQSSGLIVNVSSEASIYGVPLLSGYVASKCGMSGFSRVIQNELFEAGIQFQTAYAGLITDTEMGLGFANSDMPEQPDFAKTTVEEATQQLVNKMGEGASSIIIPEALTQLHKSFLVAEANLIQ